MTEEEMREAIRARAAQAVGPDIDDGWVELINNVIRNKAPGNEVTSHRPGARLDLSTHQPLRRRRIDADTGGAAVVSMKSRRTKSFTVLSVPTFARYMADIDSIL